MKKVTTMVFAALVAVVLSVPAWAQTTTQKSAPATNSQTKEEKKEAAKAKKAEKKAKKQASKDAKDAKKNTTPASK